MSYLHEQPLVIQGTQEESPGAFGNALPQKFLPPAHNYAVVEKCQDYFRDEIYPVMTWTRENRASLEEEWEEVRSMVSMKHDGGRRYYGRSDTYLPVYRKERAKKISALNKGLFPSDEYFDVIDLGSGDPEMAKPTKCIMQWEMETNARIRSKMKSNIAQLVDYGTAPLKFWYKKQINSRGTARASGLSGALRGLAPSQHQFQNYCSEGLAISARNLFYWYIYPETAESLDDAQLVFEDVDVPIAMVEMMKVAKRWQGVEEIVAMMAGDEVPEHERARRMLLAQRAAGIGAAAEGMARTKLGAQVTVTESWTFMQLPSTAYLPHEDPRLAIPVIITSIGEVAVEIRRNPFYHQKPPYAVGRMDQEAGFFYGTADGKIQRPMQVLINDFLNQTNDNGILALNPVSIWDVNKIAGKPSSYFPGAAWFVNGSPKESVSFDRPPNDQVQMGMQMTNMLIGFTENAGGSPPDYGSKARASNTATGMSIAQKNVQTPIADAVMDIENDQMLPILECGWKNNVQYRSEEVMVSIAGERIVVHPEMLMINAQFRYLASSQAANQQVRTQQMLGLVQAMTPIIPQILSQGYIVDFVALFKRIWMDGFGLRGFNEFIRKGAAVPQMGPPRPDQRQGLVNEQQDNYRSAMQQVEGMFGNEAEAQPGEADDFSQVRDQADQMAGMMGASGGLQ